MILLQARTGPVGTLETYVAEMSAQQQAHTSTEHNIYCACTQEGKVQSLSSSLTVFREYLT